MCGFAYYFEEKMKSSLLESAPRRKGKGLAVVVRWWRVVRLGTRPAPSSWCGSEGSGRCLPPLPEVRPSSAGSALLEGLKSLGDLLSSSSSIFSATTRPEYTVGKSSSSASRWGPRWCSLSCPLTVFGSRLEGRGSRFPDIALHPVSLVASTVALACRGGSVSASRRLDADVLGFRRVAFPVPPSRSPARPSRGSPLLQWWLRGIVVSAGDRRRSLLFPPCPHAPFLPAPSSVWPTFGFSRCHKRKCRKKYWGGGRVRSLVPDPWGAGRVVRLRSLPSPLSLLSQLRSRFLSD